MDAKCKVEADNILNIESPEHRRRGISNPDHPVEASVHTIPCSQRAAERMASSFSADLGGALRLGFYQL